MNIQSAIYNEDNTSIQVICDNGKQLSVPVNEANRHYKELQAWVAESNVISPYVAPAPTLSDQFAPTESNAVIARKLEEIADNIQNDTPLSQETIDWLNDRKALRA